MNHIEMIKNAQKADDEAFSELIASCKVKMYNIAFAYFKNEQNSLDAISETIYKAYMNIHKLKMPEYFNTWIIKILMNSCRDILKTNKKIIYIDEYNKINENSKDVLEIEFKIANDIDLYNAIERLNEKFKSVIILKYLEDMTIAQISEVLHFPEGAVKVYLRRALGILKIQ